MIYSPVLLVTTSSPNSTTDSSDLPDVSATSLFDPYDQVNFLLRLIGDDYLSLPKFNFTHGVLRTLSDGIEGSGEYVYNSTKIETGGKLQFVPSEQDNGNLGLQFGYLLTVDGQSEGWSICEGPLEEKVVYPAEL